MNTKESCKYDQAFFIKKIISVQKTNIPEEPNNTVQNGKISSDECMCPEDYQKMILDSCWSTSQRWAKAVEQLIENDLNAPGKTIKKGIISDIFSITDLREREEFVNHEFSEDPISDAENRTIYERYFQNKTLENFTLSRQALGDMSAKCYGGGKFTRNIINQWCDGTVPYDRIKVIKLAFWAKYTLEETNKLLDCAGMHKLYLKGTASSSALQNSLQDMVYIFMLEHKCYSFATAQELIDQLDYHLEMAAQVKEGADKEEKEDISTAILLYKLKNLNLDQASFVEYFKKYFPNFLSSYNVLKGNLAILFTDNYYICKNNQLDPSQNSIRALTNSYLQFSTETNREDQPSIKKRIARNNETDTWKASLINLLYAAFGIAQKQKEQALAFDLIHKHMERVFSRNDIIAMGLILNSSKAQINSLLNLAHESPLYARDFIENIIMTASDNTTGYVREVSCQNIINKFTSVYSNCYGITKQEFAHAIAAFQRFSNYPTKYYKEYMDFTDTITAMKSLQRYGWIKSVLVVAEIYPVNLFAIKVIFRYVIKNKKRKSRKPLEATEKTIYLKKLQIVRPIAYRCSQAILSRYPENVMFDFLVRKTAFYVKNNEYSKHLVPFQKNATIFKKENTDK